MVHGVRLTIVGTMISLAMVAGGFTQDLQPSSTPHPDESSSTPNDRVGGESTIGVAREIDTELTRLQDALTRIHALRGQLEEQAGDFARAVELTTERSAEFEVALRAAVAADEPADTIYESLVSELQLARQRLRDSLDILPGESGVPSYEPQLDLETLDVPRFRNRIESGRELSAALEAAAGDVRRFERDARWRAVEAQGKVVRRLNDLRIETLKHLSPSLRNRVLGISRDGIGQLMREFDHAVLSARLYRETRRHQLQEAKTLTQDLFVIGAISYAALRLGLVITVIVWIRSRWKSWLDRIRQKLFRGARRVEWKRRTEALLALTLAALPWTLFLISVLAVKWALSPAVTAPEMTILYQVVLIYGCYRLAIDVFVTVLVRIAHRYGLRMVPERRTKLLNTVRWVIRVAVPLVILLLVAERVVGRGYLYHVVVRFSWLVLLLTLLGIMISWRDAAAESYLKAHPTGHLARLVHRSRGRWYGILITPAFFVWTAGRALVFITRDLALGFEQTRKALAFVFRRRIERQAEIRGYADGEIDELPGTVLAAFTEEAVSDGPLVVDFFPGLEELQSGLAAWTDRRVGGSMLLTGERGSGKTSWLHQIDTGELPKTLMALDHRPSSGDDLARLLGDRIFPGAESRHSLDRLCTHLLERPPRVVVVDLAQHLFLATVGGYATFDDFADLVERTCTNVFWICGMSAFAWRHLQAVRPTPLVFRHRVALGGWSEQRIRELIQARVAAADIRLNYGDLIVDRLEGVSAQARLIESEEGYSRLLWDYSDGNPRVALHFFIRSLVSESAGSARVRLFRAPPMEALEGLDEATLFTLAATIAHENLTQEEAAKVTRIPAEVGRIHFDRLTELGVLHVDNQRYRVTTFWHRAAVRLLRRKNLLNG